MCLFSMSVSSHLHHARLYHSLKGVERESFENVHLGFWYRAPIADVRGADVTVRIGSAIYTPGRKEAVPCDLATASAYSNNNSAGDHRCVQRANVRTIDRMRIMSLPRVLRSSFPLVLAIISLFKRYLIMRKKEDTVSLPYMRPVPVDDFDSLEPFRITPSPPLSRDVWMHHNHLRRLRRSRRAHFYFRAPAAAPFVPITTENTWRRILWDVLVRGGRIPPALHRTPIHAGRRRSGVCQSAAHLIGCFGDALIRSHIS